MGGSEQSVLPEGFGFADLLPEQVRILASVNERTGEIDVECAPTIARWSDASFARRRCELALRVPARADARIEAAQMTSARNRRGRSARLWPTH